ncbi:MAG: hypothetical protein AAGB46_13350 [Verrucomicrobiota bacterium]
MTKRVESQIAELLSEVLREASIALNSRPRPLPFGAGVTRLGKIELLRPETRHLKLPPSQISDWLRQSLTLRARANCYSCIARTHFSQSDDLHMEVSIKIDHESRSAYRYQAAALQKRPGLFTIATPQRLSSENETYPSRSLASTG